MKERYKSLVAVFLILTKTSKDGKSKEILLQKRKNTGYMDEHYDLGASGHLEEDESIRDAIVREAMEEANIKVNENDLELVTTYNEKADGLSYLRFFFHTEIYEGEISIGEPNKCSELGWFDINNLPDKIVSHLKTEIANFQNGIKYGENGFKL